VPMTDAHLRVGSSDGWSGAPSTNRIARRRSRRASAGTHAGGLAGVARAGALRSTPTLLGCALRSTPTRLGCPLRSTPTPAAHGTRFGCEIRMRWGATATALVCVVRTTQHVPTTPCARAVLLCCFAALLCLFAALLHCCVAASPFCRVAASPHPRTSPPRRFTAQLKNGRASVGSSPSSPRHRARCRSPGRPARRRGGHASQHGWRQGGYDDERGRP
jgi:hypothetical protein